jgi:hypothetical protein
MSTSAPSWPPPFRGIAPLVDLNATTGTIDPFTFWFDTVTPRLMVFDTSASETT